MKRALLAAALCLLALGASAQPQPSNFAQRYSLASAITSSGAQPSVRGVSGNKSYQVTGTTSVSTGAATVNIEGSNDNVAFDVIGTVTLTLGTSATSGSFTSLDHYMFVRANATALSGTGAAFSATVGY